MYLGIATSNDRAEHESLESVSKSLSDVEGESRLLEEGLLKGESSLIFNRRGLVGLWIFLRDLFLRCLLSILSGVQYSLLSDIMVC